MNTIDDVREIIPDTEYAPVPGAPDFVEGILNVRGSIVTIVSGRKLFGLEQLETESEGRIIITELNGEQIGIRVDSVGDIISFQKEVLEKLKVQRY